LSDSFDKLRFEIPIIQASANGDLEILDFFINGFHGVDRP